MANELNIALPASGLTVTAQPYQAGAAVGSAISLTEVGSTGFYSGTMTGSAGTYQLAFRSAGANVGSGSIVWSGTAEVPASTFNPSTDTVANVIRITATNDCGSAFDQITLNYDDCQAPQLSWWQPNAPGTTTNQGAFTLSAQLNGSTQNGQLLVLHNNIPINNAQLIGNKISANITLTPGLNNFQIRYTLSLIHI